MAQTIQIVPKYSFPYVETHVNDYTIVNDTRISANVEDSTIHYIFPFVSSKGIDNKFIKKRTRADIVAAYGDSNFKEFGQPLMQALHVAEASNSEIWCMRVMPEKAAYANNVISVYYKGDKDGDATERKFRIKFAQQSLKNMYSLDSLKESVKKLQLDDIADYDNIPGIMTLYSAGRGKYGNNYSVRMVQNLDYEKDYGIKYYTFEIISTENKLSTDATYVGTMYTSTKYNETTLINDVLDDVDDGIVPLYVNIDEAGVEDLYEAYKSWANETVTALEAERESVEDDSDDAKKIDNVISELTDIPDIDMFDIIYGKNVASNTTNSFIEFEKDENDTNPVSFDSVTGVKLSSGDDGEFGKGESEEVKSGEEGESEEVKSGEEGESEEVKTREDVINECYIKAFSGFYDKRILTAKRIKAYALWDANYSFKVKNEMVELAKLRNDGICYLDCGIMSSFGSNELTKLIDDYSVFDSDADGKKFGFNISKNVHHYYIKESTTKKRVPVTITYYLSRQYADHILNYGSHIPFVKSYAQLSGHVKDSLAPSVEDFETDLKQTLTEKRFNFFETINDNVYQRATQNTAQPVLSDLLEENNVATLYEMKRIIEADITDRLYDFSDSESRQRFRQYEVAKFADWSNREVQSFDIDFRMSDWEAERSILHAYINVTFRGLQKRAILELDINKRPSASETAE